MGRTVPLLVLVVGSIFSNSALSQTCTPPSPSHATLQQAVDDPGCATVSLASQSYPEFIVISRSLTMQGTGPDSSTVNGPIVVVGASALVSLSSLGVLNGCPVPGVQVIQGARVSTLGVTVTPAAIACPDSPDLLFKDGFETP